MKTGLLRWMVTAALIASATACGSDAPTVHRGRVLDQHTGEPIAGAIVVGRYMGGGSWGGSGCNRAESAVSDAQGWYELPADPKAGPILTQAYKRGFTEGKPTRYAHLRNAWLREWRVLVHKWSDDNRRSTIVGEEPERYWSEAAAKAASGERVNVYLRKSTATGQERLEELTGIQKDCAGPPRTTEGLTPMLLAILDEQIELGSPEDAIATTRRWIDRAADAKRGAQLQPRR